MANTTTRTKHRQSSFTSSIPTDASNPWNTTIALGQRIVEDLGLDDSADTLGRRLAYYLSEQMEWAASATGEEVKSARKACMDPISQR